MLVKGGFVHLMSRFVVLIQSDPRWNIRWCSDAFFAMWLEGCARLSVHEAVYRQWFTSAGMNINARVKLFPVECLTLAGWFTVSVWLGLGMQNKSGHTCSLRLAPFLTRYIQKKSQILFRFVWQWYKREAKRNELFANSCSLNALQILKSNYSSVFL